MLEVMTVQVLPLSVYSSFTFVTPVAAQVMLCELPAVKLSPPLGELTVMDSPPPPDGVMVKDVLLVSLRAGLEASLTATFAVLVALFGTVQA